MKTMKVKRVENGFVVTMVERYAGQVYEVPAAIKYQDEWTAVNKALSLSKDGVEYGGMI